MIYKIKHICALKNMNSFVLDSKFPYWQPEPKSFEDLLLNSSFFLILSSVLLIFTIVGLILVPLVNRQTSGLYADMQENQETLEPHQLMQQSKTNQKTFVINISSNSLISSSLVATTLLSYMSKWSSKGGKVKKSNQKETDSNGKGWKDKKRGTKTKMMSDPKSSVVTPQFGTIQATVNSGALLDPSRPSGKYTFSSTSPTDTSALHYT